MLFNKNNNGSEELHTITGLWYASAPFSTIKIELDSATDELKDTLGQQIIQKAEKAYMDNMYNPLIDTIRLPIACLAIMRHATLSGVSHEATGRKVKMDDNEKMPFEWMIDRDDLAMRERFYRAMDSLYRYLEENETELWKASPKYLSVKDSIIKNITEFEAVYPLERSYYTYYLLQHLVIEAQTGLARSLGDKWKGIELKDYFFLVQRIAILSALEIAIGRWSVSIFPLEIAKRFSPSYQGNNSGRAVTAKEIDWTIEKLRSQRKEAMKELRIAMGENVTGKLLPENSKSNKFYTII